MDCKPSPLPSCGRGGVGGDHVHFDPSSSPSLQGSLGVSFPSQCMMPLTVCPGPSQTVPCCLPWAWSQHSKDHHLTNCRAVFGTSVSVSLEWQMLVWRLQFHNQPASTSGSAWLFLWSSCPLASPGTGTGLGPAALGRLSSRRATLPASEEHQPSFFVLPVQGAWL